jgi:hypothetical protein
VERNTFYRFLWTKSLAIDGNSLYRLTHSAASFPPLIFPSPPPNFTTNTFTDTPQARFSFSLFSSIASSFYRMIYSLISICISFSIHKFVYRYLFSLNCYIDASNFTLFATIIISRCKTMNHK